MSKKPAKSAKPETKPAAKAAAAPSAADAADAPAPRKRSKLKLALLALVPLVLAGGGFAGWTFFLAPQAEADSHAAEVDAHGESHEAEAGDGHGEADAIKVASIEPEVAAESSFTYSFALAELVKAQCGPVRMPALKAASEAEAKADGVLVNLSWMAANRRLGTITDRSCDYVLGEIIAADGKAAALAAEKAAGDKAKDKAHH